MTHVHYAGSAQSIALSGQRNAEPAVLALFWPVNCIKIGGHVALLGSCPSIYFLFDSMMITKQIVPFIIQILWAGSFRFGIRNELPVHWLYVKRDVERQETEHELPW